MPATKNGRTPVTLPGSGPEPMAASSPKPRRSKAHAKAGALDAAGLPPATKAGRAEAAEIGDGLDEFTRTRPARKGSVERIAIPAPDIRTIVFKIRGDSPYVQLRFSEKAMNLMKAKMEAGSTARSKKVREPRDFAEDFRQALHVSREGWHGIPAAAFRAACISACRVVGFKMTIAKLSIFIQPDGFDRIDGVPLVRIFGEPRPVTHAVRNATGVADLRVRAMWDPGWTATVRFRFDAGQFTATDVTHLNMRVGVQVGIGEGRNDSKNSAGMGWGSFELVNEE
jgi:hypothetical protein